jgi:hypothetical protein
MEPYDFLKEDILTFREKTYQEPEGVKKSKNPKDQTRGIGKIAERLPFSGSLIRMKNSATWIR